MSTPARKRLMRDFKRLMQDPPAGISGAPQDNNILLWNAVIFGYDAELLLSPLSIWTAVWQWLCICWFHLQPWRYSMGWWLVYLTSVTGWIYMLHPFVLLVFFDHGKFIMCWSASRDLSKQLSAHVYAAAVGNASVTSNLLMWLSDTGCDNPPSESSPLIGRWQNEISNRLSLVTLLSTAWHTRLE